MTLEDLHTILTGINGFADKVTYNAWNKNNVPKLPFICYLCTQTNNFKADNKVYKVIQNVDIELYTQIKEPATERLIEDALDANNIVWEKYEDYLETEKCYMFTYEISI